MADEDVRLELIALQSTLRVVVAADIDDDLRSSLRDALARALADHDPTKGEVMAAIHERLDQLLALMDPERPSPPEPTLRLLKGGKGEG